MLDSEWRKASKSGAGETNCVEVRDVEWAIQVRDSKDRGGGVLSFGRASWASLVNAVKAGTDVDA
ncbi:DUF397 domain-containing protein [Micromonospora sp. NPDC004704]